MNIIEFLKIVVFGIVEGFTEWLPISSTGHMILLEEIIPLRVTEDFWNVFKVVIQLGAILAVVVLYFRKLNPFDRGKSGRQRRDTMLLWFKIAAACVPVCRRIYRQHGIRPCFQRCDSKAGKRICSGYRRGCKKRPGHFSK